MAPIAVGDTLPDGTLAYFDQDDQLQQASMHSLASGKKVVLFGVPGAFTPTCRYTPLCFSSLRSSDPRAIGFQFLLLFLWIFLGFVFFKLSSSNNLFGFSMKHVPGFIESGDKLKAKGIDEILLISGMLL